MDKEQKAHELAMLYVKEFYARFGDVLKQIEIVDRNGNPQDNTIFDNFVTTYNGAYDYFKDKIKS